MQIKSEKWLEFKRQVIRVLGAFADTADMFEFPLENDENFNIIIGDCIARPIFVSKEKGMRVEYDFSHCNNTNVRLLTFSTYFDSARMEVTMKKDK